jgi:hypothetical protein
MVLQRIIYAAWLTGIALQLAVSAVLIARKSWRTYPTFTAYSLFCSLQSLVGFGIRAWPQLYIYVYWCCETIGFLLGLGVIYEVFRKLLASYPALHRLANKAFQWTVVILILVSGTVMVLHSPVEGSRFVAAFVVLEQATRIAEVGLLAFLFAFSRVFGLHWRQGVFGIALGLGLFTTIELIAITMRADFGMVATPAFNVVRALSFDCSLLVWMGYLLAPERATSADEMPDRAQLAQWNQAIMELIHQ